MNKKGEMNFGLILMTFITVIVGLVLFSSAILPNVVSTTSTVDFNTTASAGNEVTFTESNDSASVAIGTLNGKLVTNFLAFDVNRSDNTTSEQVAAGNFTLADNQIVNGDLTATINCTGTRCGNAWNVSYTYQPDGFITSSGGRSLALLILIFTALAILVVVLAPSVREKFDFG